MNLKSAELQIESIAQMEAVSIVKGLYKSVIIPSLQNESSKSQGLGYVNLDRRDMQTSFGDCIRNDIDMLNWCWDIFNDITNAPLVTKKKRSVCISNLGVIAENVNLLRRRLLVLTPSNPNYMYNISNDLKSELFPTAYFSASEYQRLDLETQLSIAAQVYSKILLIVIGIHPRTADTQIRMIDSNQISLIIWGGFKKGK